MEETKEVEQIEIKNKRELKGQVIQIIFLVLLMIAIGALIFACIKIVQYHNMFSNPLGYNIQQFGIDSCICYKADGTSTLIKSINASGV